MAPIELFTTQFFPAISTLKLKTFNTLGRYCVQLCIRHNHTLQIRLILSTEIDGIKNKRMCRFHHSNVKTPIFYVSFNFRSQTIELAKNLYLCHKQKDLSNPIGLSVNYRNFDYIIEHFGRPKISDFKLVMVSSKLKNKYLLFSL